MSDETNKLVQVQQGTTALARPNPVSSWGDEDEEIKPRHLVLKNPKSQNLDGFTDGYFIDKDARREWPSMRFIPLKIMLTRRFQSPYRPGQKRELYCKSWDRKVPVANDDRFEPQAEDCTSCPFGNLAWAGYNKKTSTGKPANACEREALIIMVAEENPLQPYFYYVQGTNGVPEVEKLRESLRVISKTAAQTPVEKGGTGGRRPELYEYVVTMETAIDNLGNPYPIFSGVEELTREEAEENYGRAFRTYIVAREQQMLAQQEAAQAAQQVSEFGEGQVVETPAQKVSRPSSRASAPAAAAPRQTGPVVKRKDAPAAEAPQTAAKPKPEVIPPAARKVSTATRPVYHPPTPEEIVVEGEEEEVTP
jgi:hypothetical protein